MYYILKYAYLVKAWSIFRHRTDTETGQKQKSHGASGTKLREDFRAALLVHINYLTIEKLPYCKEKSKIL